MSILCHVFTGGTAFVAEPVFLSEVLNCYYAGCFGTVFDNFMHVPVLGSFKVQHYLESASTYACLQPALGDVTYHLS